MLNCRLSLYVSLRDSLSLFSLLKDCASGMNPFVRVKWVQLLNRKTLKTANWLDGSPDLMNDWLDCSPDWMNVWLDSSPDWMDDWLDCRHDLMNDWLDSSNDCMDDWLDS